ncbi:MAG: hypothetical protein ACSHWU_10030 [Marinicella sp.]
MDSPEKRDSQFEFAKEVAISNMRAGVITGLIVFGIALGKYLMAQFSDVTAASLQSYEDSWYVFDLALLFLLIWGVSRHSRFAATALLLSFLASKIFQFLESGSFLGLVIGSVFLFFFARAVKGTFDYHKLLKEQDSSYKPTKVWMWVVMTPVTFITVSVLTLGMLSHFEIIPATYVKSKHQISDDDRRSLLELNLINEENSIEYFYSTGLLSVKEGGVIMTDAEIIIYHEEEGELLYDSMKFEEMQWVKQLHHGDDFEDSLYQISGKEQYRGFQFSLSAEDNIDTVFFQKLENKINPPEPPASMPMPELNNSL